MITFYLSPLPDIYGFRQNQAAAPSFHNKNPTPFTERLTPSRTHLLELNVICPFWAYSTNLFKSACSACASWKLLTIPYRILSSANSLRFEFIWLGSHEFRNVPTSLYPCEGPRQTLLENLIIEDQFAYHYLDFWPAVRWLLLVGSHMSCHDEIHVGYKHMVCICGGKLCAPLFCMVLM